MADYTQRKICVYPRGQPLHNYTLQELERIRHFTECLIAGAKNEIMMRKLQPYPALETPSTQSPPLPQMTKPRPVQGGEVKKMPYKGLHDTTRNPKPD